MGTRGPRGLIETGALSSAPRKKLLNLLLCGSVRVLWARRFELHKSKQMAALELSPFFFRTSQEDHVKIWMIDMQAPLECVFGSCERCCAHARETARAQHIRSKTDSAGRQRTSRRPALSLVEMIASASVRAEDLHMGAQDWTEDFTTIYLYLS